MIASAMVIVRDLSPSLIFIRFVTMRLNTERRFSSPRCLPLGLPLRPFRKRVAFGGFPYPTSEDVSDAPMLLFFMKMFPSSGPLISGKPEIAPEMFGLLWRHWLRFVKNVLYCQQGLGSLEAGEIQELHESPKGLLVTRQSVV